MNGNGTWAAAANAMGTLGAVCWSIQLIPQIWQNSRRKHTHGLQPTMMLLWASAGIPLGVYNITRSFPVALQIQPQILTLLSLITWAQTKYYPPARDVKVRSPLWCICVLAVICAFAGAVEVGAVYAIRVGTHGKTQHEIEYYWPVVLMGVLSALLLAAGVGRHYIDIWQERTVRGISFLFVGIDALGDLTSLVSVVFWWKAGRSLDILGLVVYGSELVLWIGVMLCGLWYNFRPWLRTKLEQPTQAPEVQAHTTRTTIEVARADDTEEDRRSSNSIRSVISIASQASGSAFRTASGRTIFNGTRSAGLDETMRSDSLRLRAIVHV